MVARESEAQEYNACTRQAKEEKRSATVDPLSHSLSLSHSPLSSCVIQMPDYDDDAGKRLDVIPKTHTGSGDSRRSDADAGGGADALTDGAAAAGVEAGRRGRRGLMMSDDSGEDRTHRNRMTGSKPGSRATSGEQTHRQTQALAGELRRRERQGSLLPSSSTSQTERQG